MAHARRVSSPGRTAARRGRAGEGLTEPGDLRAWMDARSLGHGPLEDVVLLTGGVGYPIGTLLGVMLKSTIPALITFSGNLNSWWAKIATGVLLLIFIVIQRIVVTYSARKKVK